MRLYVLDYYVNGIVKETIHNNKPVKKTIANWNKNILANSTHKSGKLILRGVTV